MAWSAAVFLRTGVTADTIIQTYRRQFAQPPRFESWESQMPDLRQLIDLEAVSMAIVILLVFGVVAIGIACSFVIFIIRNLREYGVLKAMGVSTGQMAALIVAKVLLMNLLACGVGLLMGVLAVLLTAYAGGIRYRQLNIPQPLFYRFRGDCTAPDRLFPVGATGHRAWFQPAGGRLAGMAGGPQKSGDILRLV